MKIIFFFFSFCCVVPASHLDNLVIKDLFSKSTKLPHEEISKVKIEDFTFDVGLTGSPEIITGMKGGSTTIRWGDDSNSMLRVRIYAQKRYGEYVEDLLIPMALFQGVRSDNADAALDNGALNGSWRSGKLAGIGRYCVGQHLPAIGSGIVSAGFFFYDEYGFCMQVSTPVESGVSLDSLEEFGRLFINEIANVLNKDRVAPNPMNKSEPFVFFETERNARRADDAVRVDGSIPHNTSLNKSLKPAQSTQQSNQRGSWAFYFWSTVGLLTMLLAWRLRSKRPS